MLRVVEALDRLDRRGEAASALALFVSQNPQNVTALRLAAHWQIAAGDFDDAVATLENLRSRLGDRDAAIQAGLSLAYAGLGRVDAAVEHGEAAYALAPGNPAAADAYGWALRLSGDAEGALQLLTKAAKIAPRHPMLRWHLAQALADLGRKPEAAAQARAALADPGFPERASAQALIAQLG
jgi:tetratricopeptide (TPR) repeat protein